MDIIGHSNVLLKLSKLYEGGNSPQALLFHGSLGVGKFSAAVWYTSLLNCLSPLKNDFLKPCGLCISCRKIKNRNHPDIKIIEPDEKTLNIKIEQTRELGQEASYKPLEGKFKVFIVKDSHRMLDGAASAYLKLLEEPPPHMVHILTSVNVRLLLPTIVSRCVSIKFSPLEKELVEIFLKQNLPAETASIFASISQGSIGRAISLSQDEKFVTQRKSLLDLMSLIHCMDMPEFTVKTDEALSGGSDGNITLELIILWMRDLSLLKNDMPDSSLINFDYAESLKKQSDFVSLDKIIKTLEFIDLASKQMSYQVSHIFALDRLLKYISKEFRA